VASCGRRVTPSEAGLQVLNHAQPPLGPPQKSNLHSTKVQHALGAGVPLGGASGLGRRMS
jgi:hypothetical protein